MKTLSMLIGVCALVASSSYGVAIPVGPYAIGDRDLRRVVRAEQCIANSTHCHCSMYPRRENSCVEPSESQDGKCSMGTCLGGLRCDCASSKVCKKAERTTWSKIGENTSNIFDCEKISVTVPTAVIGFTADFEVNTDGAFTLHVDGIAIGAGYGETAETFRSTAQLYASSVIAIEVLGSSSTGPAVKLRYNIDGTEHTIDDTWLASTRRSLGFQLAGFDDSAWSKPTDVTQRGAGFDTAVNWKGLPVASSELFIRRDVPSTGPSA